MLQIAIGMYFSCNNMNEGIIIAIVSGQFSHSKTDKLPLFLLFFKFICAHQVCACDTDFCEMSSVADDLALL